MRGCIFPVVVFMFALFNADAYASTIAHWRFEEGSVGSVASGLDSVIDSSGNGLHGTPTGQPTYQAIATPNNSKALLFNGTTDFIQFADSPLFELQNSLTLEAFIRIDQGPSDFLGTILFRGDDRPGYDPFYLALLSGSSILRFHIQGADNSFEDLDYAQSLPLNTLLHIAATLDDASGMMRLYIDGIEVTSRQTVVRPLGALSALDAPGLGIGNLQNSLWNAHFPGLIDEVRISDVALSSAELLINSPPAIVPEPSTWLLMSIGLAGIIYSVKRRGLA